MDQRRGDDAGRDADDADAVAAEFGRDILDQADDGGLGRRIGMAAPPPTMPAIEAVTRMTPPLPCFFMASEACFMPRNTERVSTAKV